MFSLSKKMGDIINLYPVVAAPSGPPPSPRTKARNTLESLPRGIVDCPSYISNRIYNAIPIQTVESVANFQRDHNLADETIEDLLVLAPLIGMRDFLRGDLLMKIHTFSMYFRSSSVFWTFVCLFPDLSVTFCRS